MRAGIAPASARRVASAAGVVSLLALSLAACGTEDFSIRLRADDSAAVDQPVVIKVGTVAKSGLVNWTYGASDVRWYDWTVVPGGATLTPDSDPKRMTFVASTPGSYEVRAVGNHDSAPATRWKSASHVITVRPRAIPQFPEIETTILDGRGPGGDCDGFVGLTFVLPIDPDADVPKFASLTGTCWEDGKPVFTAFDVSGTFENGRFDLRDGRFAFSGTVDEATATITITGGPGGQTFEFTLKR